MWKVEDIIIWHWKSFDSIQLNCERIVYVWHKVWKIVGKQHTVVYGLLVWLAFGQTPQYYMRISVAPYSVITSPTLLLSLYPLVSHLFYSLSHNFACVALRYSWICIISTSQSLLPAFFSKSNLIYTKFSRGSKSIWEIYFRLQEKFILSNEFWWPFTLLICKNQEANNNK